MARALDAERKAGKLRGALSWHSDPGFSRQHRDRRWDGHQRRLIGTGQLALAKRCLRHPAAACSRRAGVIFGKTNLERVGKFPLDALDQWLERSRGGQTLNPYALDRTPLGSSSRGSGAAAAASLCAAAVGSETDGSITGPASFNALVGLKPTLGLIVGRGIIPLSHSQDTSGPMARTIVRDVALLLGGMTGVGIRTIRSHWHPATTSPPTTAASWIPMGSRGRVSVSRANSLRTTRRWIATYPNALRGSRTPAPRSSIRQTCPRTASSAIRKLNPAL